MPYYNERLAKQYTEYDVAKANEYLDKAYPKKDAQGFRLGPDGKRITFTILVIPALGDFVDATQLVGQYWQAVGVDAKVQTVDRTLFYDRKDNNDQDATVFQGRAAWPTRCSSRPSTSRSGTSCCSPSPWGDWYACGGKSARSRRRRSRSRWTSIASSRARRPEKQKAMMKQILDIAADQFYVFGISTPGPLYRRGEEQDAQRARRVLLLDLSQPGRQQHRAVLLQTVDATGLSCTEARRSSRARHPLDAERSA